MSPIKHLLVPVDLSAPSREALSYALDLSEKLGARVTALYVNWLPSTYADRDAGRSPLPGSGKPVRAVVRAQAEAELEQLVRKVAGERSREVAREVRRGEAASCIIERARSGEFDLIVMGTHGRSGLDHWLMGSVAERVVRSATCPVLTVRAHTEAGQQASAGSHA